MEEGGCGCLFESMVGSLKCEWLGGRQKPWLRYGEIYISGK